MSSLDDTISAAEKLEPQDRLRLIARLWQSLPAECWPQRGDTEVADVERRLAGYDLQQLETVPWPIVERLLADCAHSTGSKVFAMPRRFDLATIFIITLAYSLLFAGMSILSFPPVASVLVGGFITLVGAGQAFLFHGNRPRLASLLVGATIYCLATVGFWQYWDWRAYPLGTMLFMGIFATLFGAVLGYLSGVIVGGVFLIADFVRRKARALRRNSNDMSIPNEGASLATAAGSPDRTMLLPADNGEIPSP